MNGGVCRYVPNYDRKIKNRRGSSRTNRPANDVLSILSCHVETVVLLSQRKADDYVEVELELDELDVTSAETKATYAEIKDYVLKEHGLKVSSLYI